MAFQPFHLPELGAGEGMRNLGDTFVQLAQMKRQREQQAIENLRYAGEQKRQGMMDRQTALAKASALWQQGDREGAKAIMAPYGGQLEQYETDAPKDWAPKLNQGEINFADTLPMDRPGGPAQGRPQETADPTLSDPNAISEATAGADWKSTQAQNPLIAAAQFQAKQNKMMAQRLTGKFDDGSAWTLDPDQGKREGMARADKAFYDASGEDTDEADQIREQYPQLRATYAAAGENIDPKGVFQQFRADAAGKRSEAGAMQREEMAAQRLQAARELEEQKQGGRLELDQQQQAGGKYKRRGAGDGTGGAGSDYNPKVERNNKAAVAALDTSVNRYAKSSGLLKLTEAHEEAERAHESLMTGNPAGQAHALEKFVSVSRGGMATNAALALFLKHLSGTYGSVEGAIEHIRSGGLGPEQRRNLQAALEQVQHSIKEQVEIKRQAFVRDYVASPAYSEMKGNAEEHYDKLFSPFGYKTEYDPNAKVIALGTGRRAAASGRGGEAPQAAAMPKDMADWVQANPGPKAEAIMKKWKADHGL